MFRARIKKEIVCEFLPPARKSSKQRIIVLCDGMPGIPRKQPLAEFLSNKGYWVFYPRYRGAWESDGEFLRQSPHEDILDVVSELPKGITEVAFRRRFELQPDEIFVIGGSFGGTTAILCSLDTRVKRVIANCPVVDWSILRDAPQAETSNKSYAAYIREAFGSGYRLSAKNWAKLHSGRFFNPAHHIAEIDPGKIMIFHAKDDPYVPWKTVERFSRQTGVRLNLFSRGGHLKTERIVKTYWKQIDTFFRAK